MTVTEFKETLDAELLEKVKAVCEKEKEVSEADAKVIYDFMLEIVAPALGEDQIAEPFRYLTSAVNGLRAKDLEALIGEDFDAAAFEELRTALGFELFVVRELPNDNKVYDFKFPPVRVHLQKLMGEGSYRACASDIGYYLLEKCQVGDPVRDLQIMHLLLDANESGAAAEYVSEVGGEILRIAVMTMGNALKDGPEYVQECVYNMALVKSEKVDLKKILMLLLNDCIAVAQVPERQQVIAKRMHDIVGGLIKGGEQDITVMYGIAKLRLAQNSRVRSQIARQKKEDANVPTLEAEAQHYFVEALNYLMPPLQQADPLSISDEQVRQYWLCLKICQEMAQPKAIALIFEAIVKAEQAQIAALTDGKEEAEISEEDDKRAKVLSVRIIDQHIDMSKLYYQLPKQLQEQFTNYSESCIALIKAYLEGIKEEGENAEDMALQMRLCNYYQTIGELQNHLGQDEDSYEAYTEAQIRQMRHLAAIQRKHEGEEHMSHEELITRLTLSVTNHMLGVYYRKQGKSQHDLSVLLRSNMDLAQDCFKAYPRDGRVIHFIINAALELGDMQHKTKGYIAEINTYESVIRQFAVLNNMRLDQQLCADIAMIHTKCGQVQADDSVRRYADATRNLNVAANLWKGMAQNTKNPDFQKNADAIEQLLAKIKK